MSLSSFGDKICKLYQGDHGVGSIKLTSLKLDMIRLSGKKENQSISVINNFFQII